MALVLIIFFFFSYVADSAAQQSHIKRDTVWRLEKYEAVDDAVLGIWPHELRIADAVEVKKLRNLFGFSYIFFNVNHDSAKFKMFNVAGFTPDRIMVQLTSQNFRERISSFKDVYAYYIDEPFENNHSIEGMKDFINKNSPGSLFIISGYRRTAGLTKLVSESDGVMFSSYKHWWQCFPGIWCTWPVDMDQRPDWSDMKERYGNKSFVNWVGSHRDTLEYFDLLEHAAGLSLQGIWLYQYQDPHNSEKNMYKLSDAAWTAGYLHKYERKYVYEYTCNSSKYTDCEWTLSKINITNNTRKASP
jgi:hypothetical protein